MAEWWLTELQQKVGHRGRQRFGGHGVMVECPTYAGCTEIRKPIIGRSSGL